MKNIGVVLVSYCGREDTLECIDSILKTKLDGVILQIIIVDNASPSNKVTINDLVSKLNNVDCSNEITTNTNHYKIEIGRNISITLINSNENLGFGAGNNIGIRYLKENQIDYLVLLNNDTIVPKDFFQKILNFFSKSTSLLAFSPKSINYYDHNKIDSEGYGYFDINTGRSSHVKTYKFKYLVGSCIIANGIKVLPFFDECIFLYSEDVDYSLRLRNEGFKLSYDSSNYFYHKVSASTSKNSKMEYIKLSSLKYIVKKHGNIFNRILFIITRSIYYAVQGRLTCLIELWKAPL